MIIEMKSASNSAFFYTHIKMLWKKYLWGHISTFYELWILMHTKQLKIMNFFQMWIRINYIFQFWFRSNKGLVYIEILTAKGWQKSVKFWRARIFLLTPIFCDFLAWRAGTTRLGQCGRKSAHISRPAGCSQLLSDYTRRRQHLQRRTLVEVREEPATVDFARPKQ